MTTAFFILITVHYKTKYISVMPGHADSRAGPAELDGSRHPLTKHHWHCIVSRLARCHSSQFFYFTSRTLRTLSANILRVVPALSSNKFREFGPKHAHIFLYKVLSYIDFKHKLNIYTKNWSEGLVEMPL